ncbi:PAS domain S-box protein [Myxococcota bacterium]|nr:PAS domain S-box protein [Myxococcota bacterium]
MVDPSVASFALLGCDPDGNIAWTSAGAERLCGRTPEALCGQPLVAAVDSLGPAERAALAAALTSRATKRIETATLVVDVVPLAADGGAGAGSCVVLRTRASSTTAAALAESEERYRRLVDACPAPIVVHVGGRIRFVNPAALALLGSSAAEDVIDRPVMEFVHPEYRPIVAERMQKILETGGPTMLLEQRIVRLDGRVIDVEIAGAAVCYEGELAIQLVGRDVTERRRIEAERRRHEEQLWDAHRRESLLRLAEGIAHSLRKLSRELLEAVDQSLLRRVAGGEPLDPVRVRGVGLRMAALTDQLLGFVGKRGGPPSAATNLSALVLELSQGLDTELGSAASLSYDLPVALPPVRVDGTQLRRVVHGLVRNAVDALGAAGGSVLIRTRRVDVDAELALRTHPPGVLRPGPHVALDVCDRGCGMDESTSARICEPFFSTKSPGRGLGLAEVTGLVGAQGGGVCVDSAPGRGTTVTLLFPALARPPRQDASPARVLRRRRKH